MSEPDKEGFMIGRTVTCKIEGRDMDGKILEDLGDKIEVMFMSLGHTKVVKKADVQLRPIWHFEPEGEIDEVLTRRLV